MNKRYPQWLEGHTERGLAEYDRMSKQEKANYKIFVEEHSSGEVLEAIYGERNAKS